jgi:L-idonate 5-dehydrogenase
MKAVVIHAAKDLRIETHQPETVGPGQVRVQIEAGGICGSDLHYYLHGGFGAIRVREPMILGHEVAGTISEAPHGPFKVGDKVAVSPSRPCNDCAFCREKMFNQCLNMRFYGSAMPMPHIQGAFQQELVADVTQCHLISTDVPMEMAAFCEPLSVVLHSFNRAGPVAGKRVLITGCGPIGALCVLVAKAKGAAEIIVTDVIDNVLQIAKKIGATEAINVMSSPDWTSRFSAHKGHFDVMFEASGNQSAVCSGLEVLRPRATLVQLGLGGDVTIPQNTIVAKEIEIRGSFRFHEEFAEAVEMVNAQTLNLAPLLTKRFAISDAVAAFELAADRNNSMKIQLDFTK